MTIQSILKRTASLLGAEEGIPSVMPSRERLLEALDCALGELARCFPIQARIRITIQNGTAELPLTVLTPRGLYAEGRKVPFAVEETKICAERDGDYTLVYYRVPPVASELPESATLPFPEDLLHALPFYCAALTVMGDDPALYTRLMEQYNTKLAAALGYRPVAGVESGGCL